MARGMVVEGPPDAVPHMASVHVQKDEVAAAQAHSAKLTMLMERLRETAAADPEGARPVKSVIFSQFAGMLAAVGGALAAEGVAFVRIDGTMTAGKRAAAIRKFAEAGCEAPRVALVSLKAGGVGLNLTAASQVRKFPPCIGRHRPDHLDVSVGESWSDETLCPMASRPCVLRCIYPGLTVQDQCSVEGGFRRSNE